MNRAEIYAEFRELVGNPDKNDVTNRQIESYLIPALEWLAVKLDYAIYTEEILTLVADQREYLLPDTFGSMILVEWNLLRIQPASVWEFDREGTDFRQIASGPPREYAVFGRKLILSPPASSAAVTTDASLIIQYIGSTPGLDGGGTPGLGNLDQQLLLLRAAIRYCRTHPTEENLARIQGYQEEILDLLPAARQRAQNAIEEYNPHFHPEVDRFGGAR